MNRYVVYTCLTGGYDELHQPDIIFEGWDYVCYSNDYAEQQIGVWQIRALPADVETLDNALANRYVKMHPHLLLPDYDYSLYIDGKVVLKRWIESIDTFINNGVLWGSINHDTRDCIYDEAYIVVRRANAGYFVTKRQMKYYRDEGLPPHYGLSDNCIILRRHNDTTVREINESWYKELLKWSSRDQLVLYYIFWKYSFAPQYLLPRVNNKHNSYFEHCQHSKKRKWFAKRYNRLLLFFAPVGNKYAPRLLQVTNDR